MTSYLHKQKKGEILDMARKAGLMCSDDMLKDELVDMLGAHLRANETSLGGVSTFTTFYQRNGSPVKREKSKSTTVALTDGELPPRKRKQSRKVLEELESLHDETPEKPKPLATRTPKVIQRVASRVPLPASPAHVTVAIDRGKAIIKRRMSTAWDESGVDEGVDKVRDYLGSIEGVGLVTLLLESLFLRQVTMPMVNVYTVPKTNYTPKYLIKLPNVMSVLDPKVFWGPSLLWMTTSLLAPALFSYFVNLTRPKRGGVTTRRSSKSGYSFDPLVFHVAKAVLSWMVYSKGFLFFGLFDAFSAAKVNYAIPGEYVGLMISAGIGCLFSLYDAVLTK